MNSKYSNLFLMGKVPFGKQYRVLPLSLIGGSFIFSQRQIFDHNFIRGSRYPSPRNYFGIDSNTSTRPSKSDNNVHFIATYDHKM